MKFSELIQSEKPVLVDFYADWCGPCKMMKPILEDLKKQVGDDVAIYKIDVDQNQNLAAQLGIQSIPTIIIFKEGEAKWRKSGVASTTELQKALGQL